MKEIQLDWRLVGSHRAEKKKLTEDVHLLIGKPVPINDLIMDLKKKYSPVPPVFEHEQAKNVPFALRNSVENEMENYKKMV